MLPLPPTANGLRDGGGAAAAVAATVGLRAAVACSRAAARSYLPSGSCKYHTDVDCDEDWWVETRKRGGWGISCEFRITNTTQNTTELT